MPYLYYNIDVRITIGDKLQFGVVNSIKIESTIEKLSDTAELHLPREFKNAVQGGDSISLEQKPLLEFMKPGDTVKIEAGYNGELNTEFEGYITEVGAEVPTVLICEDEMYKLRKSKLINHTFSSVKLQTLLNFIAPDYEVEAVDLDLGKITIEQATAYKVLERLKSDYGIRTFFKGKKLYAGLLIDFNPGTKHEFNFTRNIRSSSDLIYKSKERRQLYIKAESMQKGGGKVNYEFGTPGESEITLHAPVNLSKTALKEWCEKYLASKVFDGYEGSIDSWGEPRTEVGFSASITDPNYPDGHRDGHYFIEGVSTTIDSTNGFLRQNKISFKIKSENEGDHFGSVAVTGQF
jgi:hypothetical protein